MRWKTIAFATVLTSLALYLGLALAGTTGEIKGRITSYDTAEAIIGASVLIVGTTQGAMTDLDGNFRILRVDPGTYTLRISHLEFETVEVTGVIVAVDSTTEINRTMTPKPDDLDQTITVVGTKDILDKFVTDNRVTLSDTRIKQRPVQSVPNAMERVVDVLTTNPHVMSRGGRVGEVTYIVDGKLLGPVLSYDPACSQFPPAHGGTSIVNNEPFDAMFFKHHGVNPFVDTEDDHYSTFAVDVDDASFNMTRSYLERGHLPPDEAVRVEEFVNHFEYSYEPPVHDAFRVTMEAAPSPFGPSGAWLLRIGIKGKEVRPEDRLAANLVFVIDVSGSMAREDRLQLVKKSLLLLLDQLTPEDRVGIVIYGSDARILLNPTYTCERQSIIHTIKDLRPGGSTYAEKGIRLGCEMAARMFEAGKINRVILCSDGVANVGRTGADEILKEIKRYTQQGITLTSVGFGMGNYNDILMEKLGNKGNGFYAYVDDIAEARRLFAKNAVATLQVIARDVKVQVDFNPTVVRSYRLLGYENRDVDDDRFRDDTEDGGEIGAGHSCTVLYELKLHGQPESGLVATVFMRHKDPESREVHEINHPFYLGAFSSRFENTSADFRLATAAAEFAEILRGSYWARDSKINDVLRLASDIPRDAAEGGADELAKMIQSASEHAEELAKR